MKRSTDRQIRKVLLTVFAAILPLMITCGCEDGREKPRYKIGVSQCSSDDWRLKMNREIEREIMVNPEATVEIRSADDSNERQIADIRYFLDNGFNAIIVAPNEADAITPVIKEVYDRGVPVVVFDRNIHGESYTAWQGADNRGIGRSAAHYAMQNDNRKEGSGKILELRGLDGSTPAIERHEGFAEEIKKSNALTIAGSASGDWNYDIAAKAIDSLYRLHPDAEIVYAHNDRMAIAASDVARRRGLHPFIIGIDAAPEIGIKAVKDSVIDATFLYPTEGHRLIRTALSILKGEDYDRITRLPSSSAVDKSNADILLLQNDALKEETSKLKEVKGKLDRFWEKYSVQTSLFYALVVILLLIAGLLFFILRLFWVNKRNQKKLEDQNHLLEEERDKQEYLNGELEKATQSKLVFFTNVSHDLRTPLTLISEPIEQLRDSSNLTPQQHDLLKIADKNVRILHRLINQILDFRKYENGKMPLHLTETNLGHLTEEWSESFRELARKRDIHMSVKIENPENLDIAIDVEKMERVFFNLVSNAFKHTSSNGSIEISCGSDGENVRLRVADTGEGIPAEDLGHIFERFFQADQVRPKGSGIGLALTKAFVELHGGTLSVESVLGKGSVFTAVIPIRHTEVRAAEEEINASLDKEAVMAEIDRTEDRTEKFDESKPLVLVVEDNEDMRALLANVLGEEFNVAMAVNGKEGLKSAVKYVPDLVVSDVMMPVMDGLELCRRLKEEVSTSHIPVLLLTACSMDEQKAEGYESGADGYLSKPFSGKVLLARCRSLIKNRRLIRNIWNGSTSTPAAAEKKEETDKKAKALTSVDNEFYARFLKKVEEKMGNPDMNVDQLASELGLGRSQFYRKIKALTNYSPVELLRRLRLQRAKEELARSEKSVSEIAYEVGFSTPAYFTKCFRDSYGKTPSEYREQLGR